MHPFWDKILTAIFVFLSTWLLIIIVIIIIIIIIILR